MQNPSYQYTNNWFEDSAREIWDAFILTLNPTRILEIGSYEGASACYLIEKLAVSNDIELHCVDTWGGSVEHKEGGHEKSDMAAVERRFHLNISTALSRVGNAVQLVIHKEHSDTALSKLIVEGKKNYFDFIYIDASHQAPDVLSDACLSFRLLKNNGLLVFDDYLWQEPLPNGIDPIRCPKIAIDSFTNIYCRKLRVIRAPLNQLYIQKITD